jgi:3-methyladenine DNA glycosylase AlkD
VSRSKAPAVIAELRSLAKPENVKGMARFGIASHNTLGINIPTLRAMAKRIGRDHAMAVALWDSGMHEARILACMVEDPNTVTRKQLEAWVRDLDSWDVCDGFAYGFVDASPHAHGLILTWSKSKDEYVKRAAFASIAGLAVHAKKAPDESLLRYLPLIEQASDDDRNFVWKAVNWALRQVGKRNRVCNAAAIACAERILATNTKAGRKIANDALRELRSAAVQGRFAERGGM